MSRSYANRVVVVTGASSGIGERIALDFAERGAQLALVARRAERLAAVARACRDRGAEVEELVGDLAERDFTRSLVDRVLERFDRLDVLVNNAGIPKRKELYDVSARDLDHTLEVNFLAPAHLTLAALQPMLRQREGFVVNISSAAGRIPPPRETIYAASKFALTGFSEGLALDLAGSNVHTAVIHVGPIDTEIWERAAAEVPVRFRGRKLPPSEVSRAVFHCIEKRRHEATVPRWLWWIFLFKLLLPGLFRKGAGHYDPVAPEVIERARRDAQISRSLPSK
jgi:short-subunit dehydrogenase